MTQTIKKKRHLGLVLAAAGSAAWWLSNEKNRLTLFRWIRQASRQAKGDSAPQEAPPLAKTSAHQAKSGKLVEEGVPFTIEYYNKK